MNKLVQLLCVFAALLSLAGTASAATLIVNCNTVSSPTELSASITCPQFSVIGGTLQSAQITVSGTITGSIALTNNSASSQTVSATTSSQFNVGALAGFTFGNPLFSAAYGTGSQTLTVGQTVTVSGLSGNGGGSIGTNTTSLGGYTGAGNFLIPVSTLSGFTLVGGGGQVSSNQSTNASATAVVTYTYIAGTLVVNCNTVSSTTELSASITCPQFNPSLGTLQSVQITVKGPVSGAITGQLGMINSAATSQTGSASTTSQFNVGALAGFSIVNPVFTAAYGTGSQTLAAGQNVTFSGLTGNGSGSIGTATTSLGGYTGTGNFLIPVSTLTGSAVSGGGGQFGSSGSTNASATAVVTYTYQENLL